MKIESITLHHIKMNLKTPFTASNTTYADREFIIVEVKDKDGITGWGEGVAFSEPWYTEETVKTSWHMLEDFLIPLLFKSNVTHPKQISELFSTIRRNNMAKASLEEAVWDYYAKVNGQSLSSLFGGIRSSIPAGVAIGIQSIPYMLNEIEEYLRSGYQRFKIKIKPGMDYKIVKEIRKHYPELPLMVDANSAYSLADIDLLQSLDEYNLLMIEQPLGVDDIVDHAELQKSLATPICLDESITSFDDARKAIQLDSCRVINIKMGRVGGITEAIKIHDLCLKAGIPVWCGGMLETGIGRAHNLALSSLENFVIPGDISASARYWEKDIIEPEIRIHNGSIQIPEGKGIGVAINRVKLNEFSQHQEVFYKR